MISGIAKATVPGRYESTQYRNYVLAVLTTSYAFNFIDRQLISILQESIKIDLALSDTQLGLLTGFAFAFFYVSAGIPIARWADRGNRPNILALAVGIWSLMTAICGIAMNYVHLFLARMGVGLGEAGGTPPAQSMISDIYPPDKRGTALGIHAMGINIGVLFGFFLGGVFNEYLGWRMTFIVVGLPGILLAVIIRYSVAEPPRGWSEQKEVSEDAPALADALRVFWQNKAIRYVLMAAGMAAFSSYSLLSWVAPFFIRSHGMGTAELGIWLAMSQGVCGAIGTFLAGVIADRLGHRDRRWYIWLPVTSLLLALPGGLYLLIAEDTIVALLFNLIPGALLTAWVPPVLSILHSLVHVRMRALASATLIFAANIIGLGCGPTLIGIVSDLLNSHSGGESLRYALLSVFPLSLVAAAGLFYFASRYVPAQNE